MPDKVHKLNLTPPPWHTMRVLVIDDQHSAQSLMKGMLLQIGIRHIDTASTYREAINHCQHTTYQLILVDYHLDHTLTGSELISLLRKKQLLSPECGLVIFSADTSTRVVLAALAVEPDAFLTLPMPVISLQNKLCQAWQNSQARHPVYQRLTTQGLTEGIRYCKQQLLKHGPDYQLEHLLLDMLMESQDWPQAQRYTSLFRKYHPCVKVSLTEARLYAQAGDKPQAMQHLQHLLEKSPLCLEALDLLANYQAENQEVLAALTTAQRALKLSPSASHRALKVAQLAAKSGQSEPLVQAGMTLATHLPIIDIGWIICLAEFSDTFEQLYFTTPSAQTQRQLKVQLLKITQRAHHRLLPAQRHFLYCFQQLVLARLLLAQGSALKAKRRLLLGLSGYFNCIHKLPSVILAEALPLLLQLGETTLIADACQALKHRNRFDGHSRHRLQALRENSLAFDALRWLETTLKTAQAARLPRPAQALFHFETILRDYPLCSEAHLGRIDCLLRMPGTVPPELYRQSLTAVRFMPLPPELATWRHALSNELQTHKNLSLQRQISAIQRELPPIQITTWSPLLH
ncbi:response regulator [Photobacterium galatheae]|uniref:Response regulatory domain-containing protein n=1 Tax=Photobacterium galatheae TaxID=1654360 RepID=A0A066RXX6_9GAMM|nr:response regulator [Photobacterium galatheae]KDM92552.1 hypothetical protein EA58_05495 [Photobacterium galatheae]MCM0147597.1 response regulator [Photobacterium galatheae]